jgi:hypothetical protein
MKKIVISYTMAEQKNVQRPFKGMVTDTSPLDQPKETYRFALNGINESEDGDANFISNELSNFPVDGFPSDMIVIGSVYLGNNEICIFGKSVANPVSYIGILSNGNYTNVVESGTLGFSTYNRIKATFRIRRNNQRVVYFVDGHNKPRVFNFDRLYDFYSLPYKTWLENPQNPFSGEIWAASNFDLIKTYSTIPQFVSAEVLNDGGTIPSGSYSAAIQLVDENLNPTEWITTSNPVNIYNDSLNFEYNKIRGSRNSNSDAQNFNHASKSIKWTIANLDRNFSFYRIAVLQANKGDGNVNQALVSQLIPIDNATFTYTGNDADMFSTPVSDIQTTGTDISSAGYVEQLENRLILADIKGKQIEWCELQKYASLIISSFTMKDTVLNDVDSIGNAKNPVSSFELVGYMPGEVYSFGIVYVFADGSKSPVYHIPGVPDSVPLGEETGMINYECANTVYPDIHKCMTTDFWGVDAYGNELKNTPIRHHRFPDRSEALYEERVANIQIGVTNKLQATFTWSPDAYHPSNWNWRLTYRVDGVYKDVFFSLGGFDPQGVLIDFGIEEVGSSVYITQVRCEDNDPNAPTMDFVDMTDHSAPLYKTVTEVVAKTFGIKFDNITVPAGLGIVGFEIVRNERTENDKLIIDNVVIGPLINNQTDFGVGTNPYHSFGLMMPELPEETDLSTKGIYIFSPEHQFLNKKLSFDEITVIGELVRSGKFVPTGRTGVDGDCNGMYVNDIGAGTTFNSEYNTGEDPDGFDLQVMYRSNSFNYDFIDTVTIANPDETLYLSASGNKEIDGNIFFNASVDNKIMVGRYDGTIDPTDLFYNGSTPRLLYATLKKSVPDAYGNFMSKPYYKEHNNMFPIVEVLEQDNIVFNGDSYIAPMTINNSTYFDTKLATREKKTRVWKIVLGSVLVLAAVAVNIIPGIGQVASAALGATAAATLMSAVTVMAISYGISMLTSGIEFETMKNMIDDHYESGLKICLQDVDNIAGNYGCGDDAFLWFTDQLREIYFESSINIGLRSGVTAPISDFYNVNSKEMTDYSLGELSSSAENFEAYLMNKFTIIDRDKNEGRLYLGYASAEFYDINPDFMKKNKEKTFYTLPYEYECCSSEIETFHNRIHYSEQSYQEEKLDNYRKFLPNNYKDIEGEYGKITNIFKIGQSLMIHTEEALLSLPQNLQERITQELITFIGTGEFFAITPRKTNGYGSKYDQATIETPAGIFYVSDVAKGIFMLGENSSSINNGISKWLSKNLSFNLLASYPDYIHSNNTYSKIGIGIHATYDHLYKRILLTKIDYKPLIEFTTYIPDDAGQVGEYCYDAEHGVFGIVELNGDDEPVLTPILFSDDTKFENKSWTLSFSLTSMSWISYHSYLPRVYLSTPDKFYSAFDVIHYNQSVYEHNYKLKLQKFFGAYYPFIIELVSISNPIVERVWNSVTLQLTAKKYMVGFDDYIHVKDTFFTKLIAYNHYQSSGLQDIIRKDAILDTVNAKKYMKQSVANSNTSVIADYVNGAWNINTLRNYMFDYSVPLFSNDWSIIKTQYPIDKVINALSIDNQKSWSTQERFRSKYLIMRFIFNNFADVNDDVQLTLNYSIESEQQSLR